MELRETDPARLDADLEALFDLHRRRWGSGTNFLRHRAFHAEFAHRASRRGWLVLRTLEIDGVPLAATDGFRFSGIESCYQSGRDPAWRYSLGTLLLSHAIRAGMSEHLREFRFLRGDEPYKRHFTETDSGLESTIVGYGWKRQVAATSMLAAWKLRRRLVRRRLVFERAALQG